MHVGCCVYLILLEPPTNAAWNGIVAVSRVEPIVQFQEGIAQLGSLVGPDRGDIAAHAITQSHSIVLSTGIPVMPLHPRLGVVAPGLSAGLAGTRHENPSAGVRADHQPYRCQRRRPDTRSRATLPRTGRRERQPLSRSDPRLRASAPAGRKGPTTDHEGIESHRRAVQTKAARVFQSRREVLGRRLYRRWSLGSDRGGHEGGAEVGYLETTELEAPAAAAREPAQCGGHTTR